MPCICGDASKKRKTRSETADTGITGCPPFFAIAPEFVKSDKNEPEILAHPEVKMHKKCGK
jgi:hypothetical protein